MLDAQERRRVRHWRSISEKRQIVQLTLEPGARVAEVARAHGVNANQVFKWWRAFERGELNESSALLPVAVTCVSGTVTEPDREQAEVAPSSGSIHIEPPGRANISIESGTDPALVRYVLECLRK
jgi:transposase